MCGLKQANSHHAEKSRKSHPSWVCGLKPWLGFIFINVYLSHPSWVCGLKPLERVVGNSLEVTPFVGVWIETYSETSPCFCLRRHTLRGCVDWNLRWIVLVCNRLVTPFVGVWIETYDIDGYDDELQVTPFVGVWIETWEWWPFFFCINVTPFVGVWIETRL